MLTLQKIMNCTDCLYMQKAHKHSFHSKNLFIKNGEENGIPHTWEYAKNKNPKGSFDETLTYLTGDIVRRENPGSWHWSFVYSKN